MTKPEWGTKRTGPCGTKFYDFNKIPIICPGCGGEVIAHDLKINNKNELEKSLALYKKSLELDKPLKQTILFKTFSALDKKALTHLKNFKEKNKFIRGLRSWIGFKQISLTYEREKRYKGKL